MEASSPYYPLSLTLFFLLIFLHQSFCQQQYVGNDTCSINGTSTAREYLCNYTLTTCDSYFTFKPLPPYDSPYTIGYLLGSLPLERSSSLYDKIPLDRLLTVRVPCSCWGETYKHTVDYSVTDGDTYDKIANDVFQGLTSCSILKYLNYNVRLFSGRLIRVPLRCACPTQTQLNNEVLNLLVYIVQINDTIQSIAKDYGVDEESVLNANSISGSSSSIYPFTPILIPLKVETCRVKSSFLFCRETERRKYPLRLAIATGVGSGTTLLILVLVGYKVCQLIKKRKRKLHKEKFFKQNGGFFLQQKLHENGGKVRIFTKEEIERATDSYNESRFLGQGGYGTVYKGMLEDGTIVAIKRSKQMETNWIEQFINEVIILSQINHKHVVKLLGCCLETEFPVLVYEFISNGTLSDHINKHDSGELLSSSSLSWDIRLRIASQVAEAISYMHSAASIPIFHRDIKSSNVLLDHNNNAKVSDFGTSRFVPCDQSHLTTKVQGTFGYIDPEYFRSSQFTEKSDVYSFGVLMIELLTGKQPFTFAKHDGGNLLSQFISLEKDHQFIEILDITIVREANMEDIYYVAELAIKCLRLNGKKRPTMREIFWELQGLRKQHEDCSESVEEITSMPSTSGNSIEEFIDVKTKNPFEIVFKSV